MLLIHLKQLNQRSRLTMLNENELIEIVCRHLESEGYTILQRCSIQDHGIDIIAKHPNGAGRLLIEAKGATSARVGSPRFFKGFSRTQVFDRVAKGVYTAMCTYCVERQEGDTVALAYPDTPWFREFISPIKPALDSMGIVALLVSEDSSVTKF